MSAPLWMAEFGPDYDVPDVITADPALSDRSWHNDACPSFHLTGDHSEITTLWVEHPDASEREVSTAARFTVTIIRDDVEIIYAGDDAAAAVHIFKTQAVR